MSSQDSPRPSHRRAVSSPLFPTRHPTDSEPLSRPMQATSEQSSTPQRPQRPRTASRLMLSVKRSLTHSSAPKRRQPEHQSAGMLSTQEESSAPPPLHQFRETDPSSLRPTIEQIAMGLHLSRTPHLRPLASSPYAFSQRNAAVPLSTYHLHRTPLILPPPPPRSSMKKPATTITSSTSSPAVSTPFSSASASTTTITSVTHSAHSGKSFSGLKSRMARFLPHARSTSAPTSALHSPLASPRNSISESPLPKKAVRFNTEDDDSADDV